MQQALTSTGKCIFCESYYPQDKIGKHLAGHLAKMVKEDSSNRKVNYCHVKVESAEMFLHLLVKGSLEMSSVDSFLRRIWLDCCGHLSDFGHKKYEVSMDDKVEDVFQRNVKIFHDYDYGTTTRVFLRGRSHYSLNLSDSIMLLSRNEPLKLYCSMCKKRLAVNMCSACWWDDALYCGACSEKHAETCQEFDEFAAKPVVNSPRMGKCVYMGGTIDIERDRVIKK